MGLIDDEMAADAAEILNEIGKSVTVRYGSGTPVPFKAMISPPMIQEDMVTGGFLDTASFDVKLLRADCATHPGVAIFGSIVNYNGKDFRIVAINDRPPSAWIIFKVVSKASPQ